MLTSRASRPATLGVSSLINNRIWGGFQKRPFFFFFNLGRSYESSDRRFLEKSKVLVHNASPIQNSK